MTAPILPHCGRMFFPSSGGAGMRSHQYRQCALTCVRFASETNDTPAKLELLDLAQAWAKLADQAEKNSRLIYARSSNIPSHHPKGLLAASPA